ncbi:hypothetical protein GCM10009744_32660 [Kribbella alba]|uniref:Transcriptional regulator LacI/GalR-like sensor domain-containing protein n=1 Tax=Kribbella alba TaxID=190197 RepID=A0ABN2FCX1_9ACTN
MPAEISLIGFDDLALDRVAHSNLTTVSVSRDELGRQAGEILEQTEWACRRCRPLRCGRSI